MKSVVKNSGPDTVLIVGGCGGIGNALLQLLHNNLPATQFIATWNSSEPAYHSDRIQWLHCNVTRESDVIKLSGLASEQGRCIHWLINCVGFLHNSNSNRATSSAPEKTIAHITPDFFAHNIEVNCLPTLLLAKHFEAHYDRERPGIFASLSARVGSIEDNHLGGWFSYRCSKAALNMAIKTLSLEWQRTLPNVSVAAIHPGTTDTALSAPYTGRVKPDRLFDPERSAAYLYKTLNQLDAAQTGKFWSWDGQVLPW